MLHDSKLGILNKKKGHSEINPMYRPQGCKGIFKICYVMIVTTRFGCLGAAAYLGGMSFIGGDGSQINEWRLGYYLCSKLIR